MTNKSDLFRPILREALHSVVMSLAILSMAGAIVSTSSAAERSNSVDITGTLEVIEACYADHAKQSFSVTDEKTGKKHKLDFAADLPEGHRTGERVRVRGHARGDDVTVPVGEDAGLEMLEGATPSATGLSNHPTMLYDGGTTGTTVVRKTLVELINYSDYAANHYTAADITNWNNYMFAATGNSINTAYLENTYGAVGFSGDVVICQIAATSGVYDIGAWMSQGDAAATAQGINVGSYSHKVYIVSGAGGWAGLASVGGNWSMNFYTDAGTICHELGHNLGFAHAGAQWNNSGGLDEYGDSSDFMGSSYDWRHNNGPHKVQMGWVTPQTVTHAGSYQISRLEDEPSTVPYPQVLTIASNSPPNAWPYYFSYKQSVGFDANIGGYNTGLSIHRWAGGGNKTATIAVLSDGGTFTDSNTGLTVKQISHDTNSVSVVVATGFGVAQPYTLAVTSAQLEARTPMLVDVAANSADNPLTITGFDTLSAKGASVSLSNNQLIYTPPGVFAGNDTFAYTVTNILGVQSSSVVTVITVPQAPFNWDANGAAAGTGGTGTWDTVSPTWENGNNTWPTSGVANLASFGGTAGTVSIAAGGVAADGLIFGSDDYVIQNNSLTLNGSSPFIILETGADATINSTVGGVQGFTFYGGGNLKLNATNSLSGLVQINAGNLQLGNGGNSGDLGTSSVTNNGSVSFNRSDSVTFGNVIGGTGALTKLGSGTLTLTASNTYTGATTVSSGNLTIAGSGRLGGGSYAGAITNNGSINFNSSATQTFSGVISGNGTLTQQGSGILTLTGANTYTGTTTVSGTKLIVTTNSNSLSGGPYRIEGTGVLEINTGASDWLARNGLSLTGSTGTLRKIGTSALLLGGSDYATTVSLGSGGMIDIQEGKIKLDWGYNKSTWSGNLANLNIASGATFDIWDYGQSAGNYVRINSLTGSGIINRGISGTSTGGLEVGVDNGSGTFAGVIQNSVGTSKINFKKSGAGTQTLTGSSTYTGSTTIDGGTLTIGGAGRLGGGNYAGNITNNSAFIYNSSAAQTLSGVISGSGTLIQQGPGMLTLSGASTYTGNTSISAGTLTLANSGAINSSPVISIAAGGFLDVSAVSGYFLASGNTVSGSGTVKGSVTAASGSRIVPGGANVPGTLTFNNNVTLNSQDLTFDLGSNPATGNDRIVIAGPLTVDGTTVISLNYLAGNCDAGSYTLISYASLAGGGNFVLNKSYPNATLNVGATAVTLVIGTGGSSDVPMIWQGDDVANLWDVQVTDNWFGSGTPGVFHQNDSVTFDDTGSSSPAINLTTSLMPKSVLVNSTRNYTFGTTTSGKLSGTMSLTKQGGGSLTMGTVNDYSGDTTIAVGTLTLGVANAIPSGTGKGKLTLAGGNLDMNAYSQNLNGLSGYGMIDDLAAGPVTLSVGGNNATSTFDGSINSSVGTVELVKVGTGNLALTSTFNSYTGGTTISNGSLTISGAGRLGSGNYAGAVANNGAVILNCSADQTWRGVISGSGTLVQQGSGTLTLAGANTYTGTTSVSGGRLLVSTHPNSLCNGLHNIGSSGIVEINTGTANWMVRSGVSFAGSAGTLRKTGTGMLSLGGGDYSTNMGFDGGLIDIQEGSIRLDYGYNKTSWSANKASLNVAVGAILNVWDYGKDIGAVFRIDALNGGGLITKNYNYTLPIEVGVNNGSGNFSGIIQNGSGTTSLIKSGSGTQILSGANTYSGTTAVSAGKLVVSTAQAGTGAIMVSDGAALGVKVSGNSQLSPTTLTEGDSGGPSTLEFSGVSSTTTAPLKPGTLFVNGTTTINILSGSFAAGNSYPLISFTTMSGTGHFVLGTLPYGVTGSIATTSSGVSLNVAAVAYPAWNGNLSGNWDIGTTANWKLDGATGNVYQEGAMVVFDDSAGGTTSVNCTLTVSPGGITVNNVSKAYVFSGSAIAGPGSLTKSGSGTLMISNANTFTGGVALNGGVVNVTASETPGTSGPLGVSGVISFGGGTLQYSPTNSYDYSPRFNTGTGQIYKIDTAGQNVAFSTALTGSGSLSKFGNGTLSLKAANTYTGDTTVNAGTLVVTTPNSLKSTTDTINAGATMELRTSGNTNLQNNTHYTGAGVLKKTGAGWLGNANNPVTFNMAAGGVFDIQAGDWNLGGGLASESMRTNLGSMHVEAGSTFHTSNTLTQVDALTGSGKINNAYNSSTPVLTIGVSNTSNNDAYGVSGNTATFSGVIGYAETYNTVSVGTMKVVKAGTGTQILSGVNNYTGTTTVTGGSLLIDGSLAAGSVVMVATGATLGGSGTVNGSVTASGTIAPGNGVGTLHTGSLGITGTYACEVNGAVADNLAVTGNLNISGAALDLQTLASPTAAFYIVASYTGSLTGTFNVLGLPSGYSVSYATTGQIRLVSLYSAWVAGFNLSGNDGMVDADPDHDGITNGMEFVLGGNPATENNRGFLPTISQVTASLGHGSQNYLKFTFRVSNASVDASVVTDCQYSKDLTVGAWTGAVNDIDGVVIANTMNGFTSGVNKVEVWLPKSLAPDRRLFARMHAIFP